jgi:hypothetical protein
VKEMKKELLCQNVAKKIFFFLGGKKVFFFSLSGVYMSDHAEHNVAISGDSDFKR